MVAKGIDVEALSPRDANARPKPVELKTKAAVQLKANKEKEHPPPPPAKVTEPSSADRRDGAVYQVGKLLGKGGFAICYEGQVAGSRKKCALKIVKRKMLAKMEQKVRCVSRMGVFGQRWADESLSSKPSSRSTPRCDRSTLSSFSEPSPSKTVPTWFWNCARTDL